MLEANKSRWFEKLFAVYNRNLISRRFHSFQAAGLEFLRNKSDKIPLIVYANHSSWWDGLIAFEIFRKTKCDLYVMMEEKQLKGLPLFRKLGAFSVVRENPREAVKSINYAVNTLKNTSGTLLIFPQGEILPNDVRPLKFYNGLSRIIEKSGKVYAVPMALRYEFFGEYKPEILVNIGSPELFVNDKNFDSNLITASNSNCLTNLLDELKTDITTKNLNRYEQII